jgi:hypothetical protein
MSTLEDPPQIGIRPRLASLEVAAAKHGVTFARWGAACRGISALTEQKMGWLSILRRA